MRREDCWLVNECNNIDCDKPICPKRYLLDKFYTNAFISDQNRRHHKLDLTDECDRQMFDKLSAIEKDIVNFIKGGNSLYIYSATTGNGKTSWALRLIQDYLNNSWYKIDIDCPVLFISVPRYLLAIKENITDKSEYVQHIKTNVLNCDLVVWDDIGSKAATTFEHETLFSIIDTRINSGKSNIYTSNLSSGELLDFVGERLYSRIYDQSQPNIVEFKGKDNRHIENKRWGNERKS